MEEKRENLKRAIGGLRTYKAPDIWSEIERKLAADEESGRENLANAIGGFSIYEAPDVWGEIADQIDEGHKIEPSQKQHKRIIWSVAASVVLLITTFLFVRQPEINEDLLTSSTYSTEEVDIFEVDALETDFGVADDGVLGYVNKNCKLMLTKCENPEFKGLYDTYLELGKAKEELKGKLGETTNKEQLYKYLIRLEKDQAEIGKELLKMLRYS